VCGLTGIFNRDGAPASENVVRAMADRLQHRGPDGEGTFSEGGMALGHRRLAILDLTTAAHQPMVSADERYVLAYNGEVYNFPDLRRELEGLGRTFISRSDTEVVLQACIEWSDAAIPRFNGMFAFALWDRKERTLLLARDRYGMKPLYLTEWGESLMFASEVKAFYAHADFRAAIDTDGVREYFTFQNFFTDRTLFENVRMLPAGTTLKVSAGKPVPEPVKYWDFTFGDNGSTESEAVHTERVRAAFEAGVERQLVSDVPISAYLSGGVDSGSVTAITAQHTPNLKTFTVGFDLSSASGLELAFDEREKAEQLSALYKTEHYEMVLKAGDMERCMERLVWHLEEPRIGQSYPNFYAAQLAGKFGKVVLSGTGGDEIFAGYPWRYYRAAVNSHFDDYVDKYYSFWQRLIPDDSIEEVFRPLGGNSSIDTKEIFRDVFKGHASDLSRPEDYINHSLYFEAKTFLNGLLIVEDKLSMAHGLETRVPFLDNHLVDAAMNVPVGMKLGNLGEVIRLNENDPGQKVSAYYNKTRDGKLILRNVMKRYVPEEVSTREKQGFSAPDASWFKGESIDFVRDRLFATNARIYDYLDRSAIRRLVDDHLDGSNNRRLLIWSLLCFEQWLETFLDGDARAPGAA
jgi:asparagine synthase (glutamine-hydrolysing)